MKKIMALFCALLASAAAQAAETSNANTATATEDLTMTQNAPKILIAYYSWSGNTKEVAEKIHEEVGGDIFRIETVQPYPEEYHATTTQAKQEINEGFKPELKSKVDNIAQYDVVFIGSPNWWGTIAPAVSSFLAENDLSGKTVIPFITHGGGGVQNTVKDLTAQCNGCKVSDNPWTGYGSRTMGIGGWLEDLGYAR